MVLEEIEKNRILLVTSSKERYHEALSMLYPDIEKGAFKVGYITINKPFSSILQNLARENMSTDKYYFVDAITATVETPPLVNNCIFVSSPSALTDISLAFSALYTEKKCDLIIFDTISTLIIYQDIGSVIKFVHNLITKASVMNKKAVFLALTEDSESLIKDLNMFVDKIIEL